jgi:hypothetical protein
MKNPQPHRIRHIPTGLFYRPSTEVKIKGVRVSDGQRLSVYTKTNLSKSGKVYNRRPTLKHISGSIYNHVVTQQFFVEYLRTERPSSYNQFSMRNKAHPSPESDWQIEKFENNEWVPA